MLGKYKNIIYPLGGICGWLASIGVLTSIFTDIEANNRKTYMAEIERLKELYNTLVTALKSSSPPPSNLN